MDSLQDKKNTLVTIWCTSYNFGMYLKSAFDSFLMQETSFGYKVFVYDDASTDNSAEIIRDYIDRFPELFDAYLSPVNLYKTPERQELFDKLRKTKCHGKYIAYCEGDDYWTDPYKLQKQISFMEENPEVVLTGHASQIDNCETGVMESFHPMDHSGYMSPSDVIMPEIGILHTASTIYRKDIAVFDSDFPRADVGDYPSMLHALSKGLIYYFDDEMSVYRYRHAGSWSSATEKNPKSFSSHVLTMVRFLDKYDCYTSYKFHEHIKRRMIWWVMRCGYLNSELTSIDFMNMLDEIVETGGFEEKYVNALRRSYALMSGQYLFEIEERNRINQFEHIVIMGVGGYPEKAKKLMENNQIICEGYVLPDGREYDSDILMEKQCHMKDYPHDMNETFIVIGLVIKAQQEVNDELEKYNTKNYWAPFWEDVFEN